MTIFLHVYHPFRGSLNRSASSLNCVNQYLNCVGHFLINSNTLQVFIQRVRPSFLWMALWSPSADLQRVAHFCDWVGFCPHHVFKSWKSVLTQFFSTTPDRFLASSLKTRSFCCQLPHLTPFSSSSLQVDVLPWLQPNPQKNYNNKKLAVVIRNICF